MARFFENIKYYLGVGVFQIKLEIQRQMEYPSFLVGWLLCNPMQFVFGLLTIWATVNNFGSLAGWSFQKLTFLYGIAVVSHGLSVVLFVQTWNIHYSVIHGEFDRYFLRPMNIFFQFSVSFFNLIGVTDMLLGIFILIYGCSSVGFVGSFPNIFRLIVVILSATAIRGAIYTVVGSVSFFTKSPNNLAGVANGMFQYMSMYPLTIYPRVVQNIFTFIIPLGFISFFPASEFRGKKNDILSINNVWLWSLAIGATLLVIAYSVFKYGLKKYESAGS